ncbi:PA2169 family four-helix-bundle protein [Marixanthomonas spongiae]|uniref:DUF2383 domain-containing protein n=1 Tax=Marixanthomonas spongiae TaxID=2174845 RepID=A0A2U0I0E4_9FLAO|nr:PA2169 family four-helix-bundle protein [Marixanthomonas spongiae]PVW14571.1 hypothetical protein DDV96_08555 [Marixanthomonas spongiae]
MKKKYADFNKLNRLLVASFEAEKLYYNAAQDANATHLKRFLNYMATERNRMSHDISNELHSRGIEPLKEDSEKGNIDRTWHEIKEALEKFNATVILNQCIARDLNNIKRYDELLERKELPDDILSLLEKQKQKLQWYIKQSEQHKETHFEPEPQQAVEEKEHDKDSKKNNSKDGDEDTGRIIPLKAM